MKPFDVRNVFHLYIDDLKAAKIWPDDLSLSPLVFQ